MGPLTHVVTTKLVGAPVIAGLWIDAAVLIPTKRAAQLSHGLPGLLVAAAMGRRWLLAFGLHVALDAISHEPGVGAVKEQGKALWLP